MKNKIRDKYVPLEKTTSTKHMNLAKAQAAPALPNLKASAVTVNLRMPLSLFNELKTQANQRDVPYQSFMKILLSQSLHRHGRKAA